ncbi:MarR family winged helix-turn-helix transcriptional regulator [Ornithinimicrobium cerasi]|uniref:DNA-binding transcriptional regulator, MarR family n=1 Tax=Ornithinimicrobium cerasi TaxID=2248773 RepID=A0A285VQR4_9MICO|nr:MarR family transcriptional regulator [Ornithinimicrobium cerasi]SOC56410.1 DNA-binding transcriptional regulator, MarR family [Ornithinimicrobium cerasi]
MPASDPDDIASLAHAVRISCMRVARRVRFDADNTVAPHLFSVLARLAEEPRTVGELACIEKVSAPSMSRAVAQLVEPGLVERHSDEHDGRLVRLSLTDAGREVVRTERARRDAWMTERLEGLSAEERDVLRRATAILESVVDL